MTQNTGKPINGTQTDTQPGRGQQEMGGAKSTNSGVGNAAHVPDTTAVKKPGNQQS